MTEVLHSCCTHRPLVDAQAPFGVCITETAMTALAGTESTLGGPGMSKGGEPAVSKADTTAGSSTTQKIEKPQEVISFEAAKEVCLRCYFDY